MTDSYKGRKRVPKRHFDDDDDEIQRPRRKTTPYQLYKMVDASTAAYANWINNESRNYDMYVNKILKNFPILRHQVRVFEPPATLGDLGVEWEPKPGSKKLVSVEIESRKVLNDEYKEVMSYVHTKKSRKPDIPNMKKFFEGGFNAGAKSLKTSWYNTFKSALDSNVPLLIGLFAGFTSKCNVVKNNTPTGLTNAHFNAFAYVVPTRTLYIFDSAMAPTSGKYEHAFILESVFQHMLDTYNRGRPQAKIVTEAVIIAAGNNPLQPEAGGTDGKDAKSQNVFCHTWCIWFHTMILYLAEGGLQSSRSPTANDVANGIKNAIRKIKNIVMPTDEQNLSMIKFFAYMLVMHFHDDKVATGLKKDINYLLRYYDESASTFNAHLVNVQQSTKNSEIKLNSANSAGTPLRTIICNALFYDNTRRKDKCQAIDFFIHLKASEQTSEPPSKRARN